MSAQPSGLPLEELYRRALQSWQLRMPGKSEPYQLRRVAYLLSGERYGEIFDEGLFRWLQCEACGRNNTGKRSDHAL